MKLVKPGQPSSQQGGKEEQEVYSGGGEGEEEDVKRKGRRRKRSCEGKVGVDKKSRSEGRQLEVRVQKGTVEEGRG